METFDESLVERALTEGSQRPCVESNQHQVRRGLPRLYNQTHIKARLEGTDVRFTAFYNTKTKQKQKHTGV